MKSKAIEKYQVGTKNFLWKFNVLKFRSKHEEKIKIFANVIKISKIPELQSKKHFQCSPGKQFENVSYDDNQYPNLTGHHVFSCRILNRFRIGRREL